MSGFERPSLIDVAERAGVSRATASRALTGSGPVAPAVRARVTQAADELGYVPNAAAKGLKQRRSSTIGVLVSDLTNPFYADMAAGASAAARRAGFTMLLTDDAGSEEAEMEACQTFLSHPVAGAIVTPLSAKPAQRLSQFRVPVVEVDRQFASQLCDGVVVDNRAGAREVTQHLLLLGHRRIALLIDETDWTTGRDRAQGYRDALVAGGVAPDESLVVSAGWNVARAVDIAREVLSRPDRPTAILAANNLLAEGAFRASRELGLSIPTDVSLASFDDAAWMTLVDPAVTAVSQDAFDLGRVAVERLIARIEDSDAPPRTTVLSVNLEIRRSTASPAS